MLVVPSSEAPARATVEPCHGFDPSAARAWTDDRRDELSRAGDSRLSAWMVGELETYAQELRRAREVACGSTDEVAARGQLGCLDDLERDLEATLDLLARGGGDAEGIVTMVDELPAPSRCASTTDDTVSDPEVASLLSRARVLVRAGRTHDAYASAVLACARLQRRDVSQWAECRLVTGKALALLGRVADARPPLEEAFYLGVELRYDAVLRDAAAILARIAVRAGDDATARRWQEELRSVGQRIGDPTAVVVDRTIEAELLMRSGRTKEAVDVLARTLDAPDAESMGPRERLQLELRLAIYSGYLGDAARAHVHFDRASALLAAVPDAEAGLATTILVKRAQQFREEGRFEEALEGYRSALERAQADRGSVAITVLDSLDGIADVLTRLGRFDEALAAADESLRVASSTGNPDYRIDALLTRGRVHHAAGDDEAARRDASEALVLAEAEFGLHRRTVGARELLSAALRELGELEAARGMAEVAVREMGLLLGADNPVTFRTTIVLANIEDELGHYERAMELHMRVRDGLIATVGPDHPAVGVEHYNIGLGLLREGDPLAAVVELERSLAITRATFGEEHPDTRETAEQLSAAREAARGLPRSQSR